MAHYTYDVIVVGASLAGCAAAKDEQCAQHILAFAAQHIGVAQLH